MQCALMAYHSYSFGFTIEWCNGLTQVVLAHERFATPNVWMGHRSTGEDKDDKDEKEEDEEEEHVHDIPSTIHGAMYKPVRSAKNKTRTSIACIGFMPDGNM